MQGHQAAPQVAEREKSARNKPCPCGSGRKYKQCCERIAATVRADATRPAIGVSSALPSVGPMTEMGRLFEAFSPLRQAVAQSTPTPAAGNGQAEADGAKRSRQSAQAWLNQAARHDAAGNRQDAIAALQRAVQLAPDNPVAHYNLGLTLAKANRAAPAIASLQRAISLQPDFGRAHFRLGVVLQGTGRAEDAIAAYRRAIALGADRRRAYAALGTLLLARGDIAEAAECHRRAADDSPWGQRQAAKALLTLDRFDDAAAVLRRALARDPNDAQAEQLLGSTLVVTGHLDEAVRHFDRAIALQPGAIDAYIGRFAARRVTEADRPLVQRMTALTETDLLTDIVRMKLDYALGKALDDVGDYAAAIRHFDAANRTEKALTPYDRAAQAARVDQLIARCTPAYFARHAALGCEDETPVFVLGMPRSGTTLVEQIVSSHQEVAGGGELEYWIRQGPAWEQEGQAAATPAAIGRLAEDYGAELRRIAPSARHVTDKLPHNFMWIGLIHLVFPRARIIHCRRNPVDTCLSIYFTDFLRKMGFASDRDDLVWEYRQYERLMAHWRAVLPPDRFIDVDYESLVADRDSGARRLIAFCGLEWDDACLRPERNARSVTTASVWQVRQPVYRSSVERWRNYAPWLGELRSLLPQSDSHGDAATHHRQQQASVS